MRMIDTPSSSPLSLEPNAPGYSHASDGLPSKLLSDHVIYHNSPQEPQTLQPDIYTNISTSTQQPAEDYSISERSRYNENPSIHPSVCDAVTRQTMGQHMPNYSPSSHQPTDVGNSPIDNVSSIPSPSNVYSGLLADGDLRSEVPDIQRDPALSSLSGPLLAHFIINHTITDDHEPSLLPPEILASSEGTSDNCNCLQSTMTLHPPERHAVLSRSLLLKSSHASYNVYNNDTAGSGSEMVTDETLTSHAENFACSHKNTPIDFAPNHSSISQINHTEESHLFQAPSPASVTQDISIEDFNSSPPSSPSTSSVYITSSSPIPSSSPVEPSFQTPPTSPPSSPVKDTQLDIGSSNNELLICGTHKFKNRAMDERYTKNPLSSIGDHPIQSMVLPDGSTLPLQHQTSRVANSSNTSAPVALSVDATATSAEGEAWLLNECDVKQKKVDSKVDTHRLGLPYPKRPSIAAHRLQQKKLVQPFRSPVLPQVAKVESKLKASAIDLRADPVPSCSPTPKESDSQGHISSSSATLDSKIKYRTTRAAIQFKSPLSMPNMLNDSSLVRLTPTIQALERKLQILKRAVKVREDVQEEVLEGLVKKWTEAGREVAWEVWNLVKDNGSSDGGRGNSQSSKKRAFQGSWGWESPGDAKKPRGEEMERNWGWDVVPITSRSEEEEEEEEEEDVPKHTLGTMLMQLGVAADTLGWNDEEGSFI